MAQWDVARCGGVCTATGRQLEEGEEHYAVLFEDGEAFRREDYSLEGWPGPPAESYCFFKTRVPVKEKKKKLLVDDNLLITFFTRLAEEEQETRLHFRFVLALILMRKRILKYEDTVIEDGKEFWMMRLAKELTLHKVLNPRLNDEQIEQVSNQLGVILHGDMGEFEDLANDSDDDTYYDEMDEDYEDSSAEADAEEGSVDNDDDGEDNE